MENQDSLSPPSSPPPPPPPPQEEPDSKKLKMSTTTTTNTNNSDDEDRTANTSTTERKPRYKRRKVAILFAYCGVGYQGMQKNPGAKTIEGDLEEALYFSGAVPENERGCPKRFDFARSARTDKGVSAVGQVVSGKFYVDPPGFVERLNNNLPSQFRIFGYKRVTASFSAKKFCDRRRYVYLLPVFALDPASHRDRESVLASIGSENELVKCLECSERGRKVLGAVGVQGTGEISSSKAEIQSGISSNTSCALSDSDGKQGNLAALDNGSDCKEALIPEPVIDEAQSLESSSSLGKDCDYKASSDNVNGIVKENVFCYGDKERQRFNKILKQYEGTHNFHNFTTRTKAADPSANRYIISFHANTTVTVEGIEFVKCEVVGQSFMLHQIRKMIGVAVAIMRNCAPESLIETALQQDVRINVPTAPEVGLYLDECFFSSYNQKWKDTHEEVSMNAYTEEAEEFKLKHIYSHIASTEHKEGAVAVWLHSLNYRNYPDLSLEESKAQAEETTGCNRHTFNRPNLENHKVNPCNEVDPFLDVVASGRVGLRPIRHCGKTTVLEIDLEHLATTMKKRLNLVLPFIQELRDRYTGDHETSVTNTIIADVEMMVDTAILVTYNRLRYLLQHYEPTVFVSRMNPRSPLSNKYKFPAFVSFVLGSIGPLCVTDDLEDTVVVYATSANRGQTYGRGQRFDFDRSQFFRLTDNLAAIGVPLAPIGVKASGHEGSFFSTVIPTHENGLWDFTATCHPSRYTHHDIVSAWLTLNEDPALRAFEDCSLTINCCTDPDIINRVIALRVEDVPDILDGATGPTRPVGGTFDVNVFGVPPAVPAEGVSPTVPAAVYILGQGGRRYGCTSLGRDISEHEMVLILRNFIFKTSWRSISF